ncbi:MAG: hypothetical protein AB2777_21190 [Candidatus Thiodiazotropha endolucinida]
MTIGVPVDIAILLDCNASATAPAATMDIVVESGYKGPFNDLLLSIVTLDGVWRLILFSIGIALVMAVNGSATEKSQLYIVVKDIGGTLLLGHVFRFFSGLSLRESQAGPIDVNGSARACSLIRWTCTVEKCRVLP